MNTIKAKNRILSFALALCLLLAMVMYLPGPVEVSAALPDADDEGNPWDGIDVESLAATNSGIYYGTYKHRLSSSATESSPTPILWRVMEEDAGRGNLTLLSEYVLDDRDFRDDWGAANANQWEHSDIRTWLNGAFITDSFNGSETTALQDTPITTSTYAWNTTIYNGSTQSTTDKVYLPWGTHNSGSHTDRNKVWWNADDGSGTIPTDYLLDPKTATYKGSNSTDTVQYWLRSPNSNNSFDALFVFTDGNVGIGDVNLSRGVRPAFQLNPSSVIFTSEISNSADITKGETQSNNDYSHTAAVGGGAKNYKLTIVNTNVKLDSLSAPDGSLTGNGSETLTIAPGGTLDLTGTISGGAENLVYKIVDRGTGRIVGYGAGNNTTDLTVRGVANVTGAGDLSTTGNYTLYVWAQDNNDDHSHEGSQPMWFPLKVKSPDTTKPEVAGVFPSGGSVSLGTSSLSVTFDEDMDTNTTGTVNIDEGATLINESWENDRTITYELDDLKPSTQYTVTISGFKDLADNEMDSHTHYFTTADAPSSGQHMVTVRPDPAGAGSPSASHANAAEDDIVTLTAKPNEGWEFTCWSSDSSGVVFDDDESETTTFNMPDEDVVITAHYTEVDDGNGDNGNGDNGNGDNGNGDNNGNGGGSNSSGYRNSSRSSGGSSTPDSRGAKTQLPASAFSWDGDRTLTIDHERITPLGLLSVQWDGTALTRGTEFSVYEGSVIVRFDESFIAGQSPGEHTVRVEFLNHTGDTAVTVGGADLAGLDDNDTHNPNTGGYPDDSYTGATDNPNTGDGGNIWPTLLLGSIGAAALVFGYKTKIGQ